MMTNPLPENYETYTFSENLKDHNTVQELLLKTCKPLIENRFPIFVNFQDGFINKLHVLFQTTFNPPFQEIKKISLLALKTKIVLKAIKCFSLLLF